MVKWLEEIKKKFEDFNFTIEECDKIFNLQNRGFLDNRLNIIFYKKEDKDKIPEIKENLLKKIEKAKLIQNNIYDNYNYLNTFFKKDERIKKYKELKEKYQ